MREVGVIIKERGHGRAWRVRLREEDSVRRRGRTLRAGAGMGPEVLRGRGTGGKWEAARRWRRWEVVNSTTVDDFSGWTCTCKLLSSISASKLVSCSSNMRTRLAACWAMS